MSDCFLSLTYLDLSNNKINDAGLIILSQNVTLFTSLQHLDLSSNHLTDKSMNFLFNSALFLTSLNLNCIFNYVYYFLVNNILLVDDAIQLSKLIYLKKLSINCTI